MKIGSVILTILLSMSLLFVSTTMAQDEELDVVKVVYSSYHSFSFIDIGIQEGYFADQNIEIEKVSLTNPSDGALLLIQGDVDVLPTQITSGIVNAMLRSDDLKIVGNMTYLNPERCNHMSFLIADMGEDTIQSVEELAGTTIVVTNGVTEYILEQVLNTGGLTLDDVTLTIIPPPARIDAVKEGSVSMIHMPEPWLTRSLNSGLLDFAPNLDYAPNIQLAVLMYGSSLNSNPDLGKRFMVAATQALRQFNDAASERNVEIVSEALGYEPEFLEEICWQYMGQDGVEDVLPLQPYVDWLYERDQIDEPIQIGDYYDTTYVDYANEVLGPYEEPDLEAGD